jgi:hypothetical protein
LAKDSGAGRAGSLWGVDAHRLVIRAGWKGIDGMIVCTRCGFQNEDSDTFCGSCAGFLEWSGEKVAAAAPEPEPEPAPPPEPEAEPDRAGFIDRVKDRMGMGDSRSGEATPAAGVAAAAEPGPDGGAAGPAGSAPAETPAPAPVHAAVAAEPVAAGPGPAGAGPAGAAAIAEPAPEAALASPAAATTAKVTPIAAPPPPPAPAAASAEPAAAGGAGAAAGAVVAGTVATAAPPPAAAPPAAAAGTGAARTAETAAVAPSAVQPNAVQPNAVQPSAVQPEAVKPAAVKARPAARAKTAPARTVNPGDLVCGQCGEGNDPNRKFCRRCGASLQRATVFVLPWYQRWWRKLTTRKTRAAGDRPRNRRRAIGGSGPGWLTSGFLKVVGIAIVLGVLLTIVGPWRDHLRHDVSSDYHRVFNDVHPKYNPVHPFMAIATSAARLHPAANAIDGAVNTSWQTNTPAKPRTHTSTNGVGQSLSIRLATASNLDEIGFLNGDQDTPSAYLTQPRPEKVHVTAAGAHPYSKDLTLKDTATFQTFTIKAKDASSLTITIDSVYPSDQGTNASIAEVELFVKS